MSDDTSKRYMVHMSRAGTVLQYKARCILCTLHIMHSKTLSQACRRLTRPRSRRTVFCVDVDTAQLERFPDLCHLLAVRRDDADLIPLCGESLN